MPRPRNTDGLSISDLERLLQKRRSSLQELERQRMKLSRKLMQVERRIRQLGGRARGGGRARNAESLTSVLEGVLKGSGKAMRVGDIVEAVQRRGYRSSSGNFRGIVNQTLIKDKRFGNAGRGLYQLRKP